SSFLLLSFSIILPYLIVDLKLCNRTYKAIIPENLDEVKLYLWEDNGEIVGFSGVSAEELVMLFLDPDFIDKVHIIV
ncbi:hypothetical protein DVX06_13155, partial [Enterococcus faecium]